MINDSRHPPARPRPMELKAERDMVKVVEAICEEGEEEMTTQVSGAAKGRYWLS